MPAVIDSCGVPRPYQGHRASALSGLPSRRSLVRSVSAGSETWGSPRSEGSFPGAQKGKRAENVGREQNPFLPTSQKVANW